MAISYDLIQTHCQHHITPPRSFSSSVCSVVRVPGLLQFIFMQCWATVNSVILPWCPAYTTRSCISPPNIYMASNVIFSRNSYTARSPWWSGNARMKPASTEQLRNSLSIASMFTWVVSVLQHIDKPKECVENAAVYAMANLCQLNLTKRYLSFWRTREAKADRCRTRSVII